MIDCDDPLHTGTKRHTRKMISTNSKFINKVYVIAPFNEENIFSLMTCIQLLVKKTLKRIMIKLTLLLGKVMFQFNQ